MHIATTAFGARIIRFNKHELTTLEAAASIAERARELVEIDSDLYVDMAPAEHGPRFLISERLVIE